MSIAQKLLYHLQFTKNFRIQTPVPANLCVERLGELPFQQGKHEYIVEYEPTEADYQFWIRIGNKYQFTPQKARCFSSGSITQQDDKTIVQGEVKVGRNRTLQMLIIFCVGCLLVLGAWTTLDTLLFFTLVGTLLIFASLYSFIKSIRERNAMLNDIQAQITPYASDREERLSDRNMTEDHDDSGDLNQQSYRRQQ